MILHGPPKICRTTKKRSNAIATPGCISGMSSLAKSKSAHILSTFSPLGCGSTMFFSRWHSFPPKKYLKVIFLPQMCAVLWKLSTFSLFPFDFEVEDIETMFLTSSRDASRETVSISKYSKHSSQMWKWVAANVSWKGSLIPYISSPNIGRTFGREKIRTFEVENAGDGHLGHFMSLFRSFLQLMKPTWTHRNLKERC